MEEGVYRLKYRDSEGKTSIREIRVIRLEVGKTPGTSYIRAYCFSAGDMRTFRFDRIRALYLDQEQIKDPLGYLAKRYESVPATHMTASQLAAQALDGDEDVDTAPAISSAPIVPLDIPKAKKKRRNRYIIAGVLLVLSIITFPTILWGIVFLVGALFFLLAGLVINGDIYEAENPST
jgi:hypothetical protein